MVESRWKTLETDSEKNFGQACKYKYAFKANNRKRYLFLIFFYLVHANIFCRGYFQVNIGTDDASRKLEYSLGNKK